MTGTYPGTTDYSASGVTDGTAVNLVAPADDPAGYTFSSWTLNGAAQTSGQKSITFTMSAATRELLDVFFTVHDPTTLNRQGNDAGEQYRSVIFYTDEEEQRIAEDVIAEMTAAKVFPEPIVTAVEPAAEFYIAENYHQNYYNENSRQSYCMFTISPKLAKLEKKFAEKLRA